MERNFYNEEFEKFLKQKSDQYKMYPSDKVWGNIYSSLHNRRRWMGLGILLLLISAGLLVSREVLLNNYSQVARKVNQDLIILTPSSPISAKSKSLNTDLSLINNVTIKSYKPKSATYPFSTTTTAFTKNLPVEPLSTTDNTGTGLSSVSATESQSLVIENNAMPKMIVPDNVRKSFVFHTERIKLKQDAGKKITVPDDENDQKAVIRNTYNGSIGIKTLSNWSLQLYASPIVSYRRLTNLNRSDKYVPVAINYSGNNIDNYVHHKPALGFEIGTKVQYKLSNSLHFYVGAQLNYSRYYIDAYNYHSERATIALNASSPVADTLANYTSIRNFAGYSPEQLQNQYFQVSVPIGAELKLLGNNRLQLSIAGAIQPTYLISSSSYLISTDYKNYIQNPDLTRKFNIHTNFEAFVSYKLGGLKWQLGPQFRYQVLSSYSNKYPIREYLTEFGIKLGITKTLR
jgi:hypothetical protein